MKRVIQFLLLALISITDAFACLNGETLELKEGTMIYTDSKGEIIPHGHYFHMPASGYANKAKDLNRLWEKTKDIDYLSDLGIILILQKKYLEAEKIYLEIEQLKPNRYSTASNIGTLYELMGENIKAFEWIKKAVNIDPSSHKNSEWIHLKILEAKIKGTQFITSDFLINTNFGSAPAPTSKMSNAELLKLRDALFYQLNERVSFIEDKDSIVATLLFDLGNIAF
jgi:tetratricopeptide (TPR) repeat protein